MIVDPSERKGIGFHIRTATEEDIATYEKAAESVRATPELVSFANRTTIAFFHRVKLRENLFEKQFARAFVAVEGEVFAPGQIIGLALYFFNFSTWTGKPGIFLEDLYVTPTHRGIGIAKALFGELGRVARENNCGRVDWSVLKWNTPAIDFYEKKLGAVPMSEWMGMRLEGQGIVELEKFIV